MRSSLWWALFALLAFYCQAAAADNLYCGSNDCYSILGIEKGATAKQIKKAFYKMSVQ